MKWNKLEAASRTHQEAIVEAGQDGEGEGDGRELEVAEVSGEGLHDDVEAVGGGAGEDGRTHDLPQLLRLLPHPPPPWIAAADLSLLLLPPCSSSSVARQQRRGAVRLLVMPSSLVHR